VNDRVEELLDEYLHLKLAGAGPGIDPFLLGHADLDDGARARLRRLASMLDGGIEREEKGSPGPVHSCDRIGPYRLIRELGRGGQGVVHLADDTRLRRRVALKVRTRIVGDPIDDEHPRELDARFRREAEILSRLDHPGICVVYEVGELGDSSYIAMRHVEGETLAKKIADARSAGRSAHPSALLDLPSSGRRATDRVVELMEECARALHAAHEANIVHRDVKPSNIMVTPEGRPVLLDFGMARDFEPGASTLTVSGGLLGTPAYMSPEQLSRGGGSVDHRADVYALGVTMYECLTLVRPFDAPTREQLYRRILTEEPPSLLRFDPSIPRDVRVIVETALSKEPDRRYPTALDLAEDLRRARLREPIRARPAGFFVRCSQWVRRHPRPLAIGGIVLALAAGLGISLRFLARAREGNRRGDGHGWIQASVRVRQDNPCLALLLAIEGAETMSGLDANDALLAATRDLRENGMLETCSETHECTSSPDGRYLQTIGRDGTVEIWDAKSWMRIELRPESPMKGRGAFSQEGRFHAILAEDGSCRVRATDTWQTVRVASLSTPATRGCALWAGGRRLLTWHDRSSVRIWDLETGSPIRELPAEEPDACAISGAGDLVLVVDRRGVELWKVDGATPELEIPNRAPGRQVRAILSPDGKLVLAVEAGGRAGVWQVSSGECVFPLPERGQDARALAFDREGRRVLVSHTDSGAEIWDVPTRRRICELSRSLRDGSFSPDGRYVVDWGSQRTATVWKSDTGEAAATLAGHEAGTVYACFSSSDPAVITASADGTLRKWTILSEGERATFRSNHGPFLRACFDPTGTRIAASTNDGWAEVIDLESRATAIEFRIPAPRDNVQSLAYDRDGRILLTAGADTAARLWDSVTGTQIRALDHGSAKVYDAAFSPDGTRIVTAADDRVARIWDTKSGALLRELSGHSGGVRSARFDGSGERVITCSEEAEDASVRIWDARAAREILALRAPKARPIHACLSPDGRRALAACWGGTACLWEVPTGSLRSWPAHPDNLTGAVFSPDGRLILSSNADPAARLWSSDTLEKVMEIGTMPGDRIVSADFSPDGRRLVTVGNDGSASLWPVDPLERARQLAPRRLTKSERDRYEIAPSPDR